MRDEISRRTFFKRATAAGILSMMAATGMNKPAFASMAADLPIGTVIDLTKCDGCSHEPVPLCVNACVLHNQDKFPEPEKPFRPYWPQKNYEDWSDKRDIHDRLTPYNWTFVEQVKIEHKGKQLDVYIPRRCMHCDHATCQKLCPFSAIDKEPNGAVIINDGICFGGAKCRDVCPWQIPQRQAGVGLYLDVAPDLAGGGVMYKCDLCQDLLEEGKDPACKVACPQKAILIGTKEEMKQYAHQRAEEIDGYVYGDKENGGTATFYISPVPFEKINEAIILDKTLKKDTKPGRPEMPVRVPNYLESEKGMLAGVLTAPFAGMALAGLTAFKTLKGPKRKAGKGDYHGTANSNDAAAGNRAAATEKTEGDK